MHVCACAHVCVCAHVRVYVSVRSNGILWCALIVWHHATRWLDARDGAVRDRTPHQATTHGARRVLVGAAQCALIVAPLVAFQAFAYRIHCVHSHAAIAARPWCGDTLPWAYGYIQSHYWYGTVWSGMKSSGSSLAARVWWVSRCDVVCAIDG